MFQSEDGVLMAITPDPMAAADLTLVWDHNTHFWTLAGQNQSTMRKLLQKLLEQLPPE